MNLPLRITYQNNDYLYHVLNSSSIKNKESRELEILLNKQKISLIKDSREKWVQKDGECMLDPEFVQALGRTVSLRFRM